DRIGDLAEGDQPDLAALAVDRRADVVLVTVLRPPGLLHRLLHRLQHLVALDALFAGDRVGDLQQLEPGHSNRGFHGSSFSLVHSVAWPPPTGRRSTPAWRAGCRRAARRPPRPPGAPA